VHTFHGHLLTDPEFSITRKKINILIEKFLSRLTQKLIVTGKQVAIDLLAKGVGKPDQYVSIPGVSQLANIVPREMARSNLKLGDEFVIIWSARVVPVKNPRLLVEVANLLPEFQFLMFGDGVELDLIRTLAPPNLKIYGFIPINTVLTAADIFLSTSFNEGIPYSILEAQSVGIPILATHAGALSELIKDGVNGYLVEPEAKTIAEKLLEIKNNPELLDGMKLNVRNNTNENDKIFTISHIDLYQNLSKQTIQTFSQRKDRDA
jgi:glycosyltransferase involved in cell wall biosynthesis